MNNQSSNNIFDLSCLLSGHGQERDDVVGLVGYGKGWVRLGQVGRRGAGRRSVPNVTRNKFAHYVQDQAARRSSG